MLPEVPKDVTIHYVNSSTVRVGWSMVKSDHTVIAYHVELSTSSGNVFSRKSSSKERSILLTHLQPNVEYRVRVQAENAAGNGSSSSYVSINMEGSKSGADCCGCGFFVLGCFQNVVLEALLYKYNFQ